MYSIVRILASLMIQFFPKALKMMLVEEQHALDVLQIVMRTNISYFDIESVAQLQILHRSSRLLDLQWKSVAHIYVREPNFWSLAAQRPSDTAQPLQTWMEELKRLVEYKQRCRDLGFVIDDAYIMRSWEYIDKKSHIVSQERNL